MKVHTLNSIYEIDQENSRIRRLEGDNKPTQRFSLDNEWRTYVHITEPQPGASLIITWPDGQPDLRDYTITSTILGVEEPCFPSTETSNTSPPAS